MTRDKPLLGHAEDFYSAHGLSVLQPAQLIGRFEELRNEPLYQRERLAGTRIRKARLSYAEEAAGDSTTPAAGEEAFPGAAASILFRRPGQVFLHLVTDETFPGDRRPLAFS